MRALFPAVAAAALLAACADDELDDLKLERRLPPGPPTVLRPDAEEATKGFEYEDHEGVGVEAGHQAGPGEATADTMPGAEGER